MKGFFKVGDYIRACSGVNEKITANKIYEVISISDDNLFLRVIDNQCNINGYRFDCFEYNEALNREIVINNILE